MKDKLILVVDDEPRMVKFVCMNLANVKHVMEGMR